MPLVEQVFLRPNTYVVGRNPDGSLRRRAYTKEDFSRYAKNTLTWMKEGRGVPLLEQHVAIGETPVAFDESSKSALKSRGWLKDLKVKADGSISHVTEVTDAEAHKGILDGSIKFTSPSIEPLIDGTGRDFGMGFRHFALTPKPRNPDQTPLVGVADEAAQFSLDDAESIQMADDEEKEGGETTPETEAPSDPPENPDMPKDSDEEGKKKAAAEAIVANLNELGVVLPDEFDLFADAAPQVMLAALKTAVAAKQAAEVEEPEEEMPEVTQASSDTGMQFDESDPHVKALLDRNRKLTERVTAAARADLDKVIASVPVPGIRDKLRAKVESVQFAEDGGEQPSLTIDEVASLFKGFPEHLQFSETTLADGSHRIEAVDVAPGHVSHEKAQEIIAGRGVWREPALAGK